MVAHNCPGDSPSRSSDASAGRDNRAHCADSESRSLDHLAAQSAGSRRVSHHSCNRQKKKKKNIEKVIRTSFTRLIHALQN